MGLSFFDRCFSICFLHMPRFSVVIPLYNKALSIRETLRSVLSQSFIDFEVIVVNDGSTDGSLKEVGATIDPRIRLISQQNQGEAGARNVGISHANAQYIAFLDADDLWSSNHLAVVDSLIDQFPEAGVFATRYSVKCGDLLSELPTFRSLIDNSRGTVEDYFKAMVRCPLFILPSCAVVPLSVFQIVGGFSFGQKLGADQDMWSRITVAGYKIAIDKETTVTYREDAENRACVYHRIESVLPYCQNLQGMLDRSEVPAHLVASAKLYVQYHLLNVARDLFASGNLKGGFAQLSDARLCLHPFAVVKLMYFWTRAKL